MNRNFLQTLSKTKKTAFVSLIYFILIALLISFLISTTEVISTKEELLEGFYVKETIREANYSLKCLAVVFLLITVGYIFLVARIILKKKGNGSLYGLEFASQSRKIHFSTLQKVYLIASYLRTM